MSRLEQRLKVELGLESAQLFTLCLYGAEFTFGEPLYKHISALRHWLDIPKLYRRLSIYIYAIDNEPITADHLRRYLLCKELMHLPPRIVHFLNARLEQTFPFVDYSKIIEYESVLSVFTELDPPAHVEELFLRCIAQLRQKKWHERFRLLKKALGVLTTSDDFAHQIEESFFIDPNNPTAMPERKRVQAVEVPLLLGLKPELEKILKSRIHIPDKTLPSYTPPGAYYEDAKGKKLPPMDMTHMTSDEFRRMFSGNIDPDEIESLNMAPVTTHSKR